MLPILCLAQAALGLSAPAAQDSAGLGLAPADSFFVAHLDSVTGLRAALDSNQFYRFIMDEGGVMDAMGVELPPELLVLLDADPTPEQLAGLDEEWALTADLIATLDGGVTAYGRMNGFKEDPTIGLVLEPGSANMARFTETMQKLMANESNVQFVQRQGLLVGVPRDASGDGGIEAGMVFGDGVFAVVMGDNAALNGTEFERMVTRLAGAPGESVLDNPRYTQALRQLSAPGQADFFLDLAPLMTEFRNEAAGEELPNGMTGADVMDKTGISEMEYVVGRMHIGAGERTDFEVLAHVPAGSMVSRLLDNFGSLPLGLMRRLPADALSVSGFNFDLAGLVDDGIGMADVFMEGASAQAEMGLQMVTGMLGVDIRADFLNELTGEVAAFQRAAPQKEISGEPTLAEIMSVGGTAVGYLIGLRDSSVVEGTVQDLIDAAAMQSGMDLEITEAQRDGVTVYAPAMDTGMGEIPFAWGFGAGIWALGMEQGIVAEMLQPQTESFNSALDDPTFGPLIRANSGASGLSVGRTAESLIAARNGMLNLRNMMPDTDGVEMINGVVDGIKEDYIRANFQGVMVQVLERTGAGMRLHTRTQ